MFERKLVIFTGVIITILGLFILWHKIFRYSGEFIASKGVYHKANCELLKLSSTKEIILYKSYKDAIKANNRPCQTCNPQQYTAEEIENLKSYEDAKKNQTLQKLLKYKTNNKGFKVYTPEEWQILNEYDNSLK
jgi:methylphosphotriester-DNA--protein-cysteine methyltransferase